MSKPMSPRGCLVYLVALAIMATFVVVILSILNARSH